MYGTRLEAEWKAPKPVNTTATHKQVQHAELAFVVPFGADVASGLGEYAKHTHQALIDGETRSVPLDLASLRADVLVFDEGNPEPGHSFCDVVGVKAIAKCKKPTKDEDDPEPTLTLRFTCERTDDNWLALSRLFDQTKGVEVVRREQQSLDLAKDDDDEPEDNE